MKTIIAKFLLLLALAEGSLLLLYSVIHPSEPENARLFGFSYTRLGLMGAELALLVLIALLVIKAFRDKAWLENAISRIIQFVVDIPGRSGEQLKGADVRDAPLRKTWVCYVLLVLLMMIFSPVIYSMIYVIPDTDYASHIYWAEQMKEAIKLDVPNVESHSGWQILVILIQTVTGSTFPFAGFIATMLSMTLMALVLFHWIKPVLLEQNYSLWWGIVLAIGLNLVTPVLLAAQNDLRFYFGYLGINSYHNPTSILLRPFALLQFIYVIRALREENSPWRLVITASIISLLATYIKPVFTICLIPALGLIMAYRLLRGMKLNWRMLVFGIFLPTGIILIWQFLLIYSSGEGSGIVFFPFGVMQQYSEWLLAKFLLSILFPLGVLVLYFKRALRDIRVVLGWLSFIFGAFYTYFLAESGPRFLHGNFTWSGEIATLILLCVSTLFFIEQIRRNRFKALLLKSCWALHAISGIIYYISILVLKSYT